MVGRETAPPEEFLFSVGGFNSPSFQVESFADALFYSAYYVGLRREEYSDGLDLDTWDFVRRAIESDDEDFRTTALSLIESSVDPLRRPAYYYRFGFEPPTKPFPPIKPRLAFDSA